ncbi:MAG: metallophosphoesterase [Hyphomicrobiaceae bacterium]
MTDQPLFTFAIITDTHIRPAELDESSPFPVNRLSNDRARYAIAAIKQHNPAFVLHLGDMVHPLPHLPTYGQACEEAHDIFSPLRSIMHFMPGNHDIGDKPNPDAPAGPADADTISQYESQFGASYHSFERQDCVFMMINSSLVNSGTPQEAEQRAWLEETLAQATGRRIFLCSHYPPFIYSGDEQSHYDNFAEPGRSWFLGLVEKHSIEAVFSGHVHQFFYNRINNSRLYCFLPTSFVRQDYSEMYAIEPPKEYGRNDTGKFGYALVDVFAQGHRIRIVPTDGNELPKGKSLPADGSPWRMDPATPITVPLRHAWATPIDLPYNGPMEEFARKRTRNDYTLMRLKQMGLSRVRVPLTDLIDPEIRGRIADYATTGIEFSFFSLGVPDSETLALINSHRGLVAQLEIVGASDDLDDISGDFAALSELGDIPIVIGKSHSSKHEPKQGSKFAHSVSSGFKWEYRDTVLTALRSAGAAVARAGLVFQLNLDDDLPGRLADLDAFGGEIDRLIEVNIRIANPNPAIANFDDDAIAARVAEAVQIAPNLKSVSLQIDTFVDVDRGYNPRHGLLDRHYNFRAAGRALASR